MIDPDPCSCALCQVMPLTAEHLRESGLARVVLSVGTRAGESRENQELVRQLISNWTHFVHRPDTDRRASPVQRNGKVCAHTGDPRPTLWHVTDDGYLLFWSWQGPISRPGGGRGGAGGSASSSSLGSAPRYEGAGRSRGPSASAPFVPTLESGHWLGPGSNRSRFAITPFR
jgi:hypothetical protein